MAQGRRRKPFSQAEEFSGVLPLSAEKAHFDKGKPLESLTFFVKCVVFHAHGSSYTRVSIFAFFQRARTRGNRSQAAHPIGFGGIRGVSGGKSVPFPVSEPRHTSGRILQEGRHHAVSGGFGVASAEPGKTAHPRCIAARGRSPCRGRGEECVWTDGGRRRTVREAAECSALMDALEGTAKWWAFVRANHVPQGR